jgi:N-methylhydantoinase A
MGSRPFSGTCRIGIDVGGTFTDFVLFDRADGSMTRFKEPSVPDDPSASIEHGLPKLLAAAGRSASDVELIVHGTTLLVNAIIQRRGAPLALVVSAGNRGILEIGRANLAHTQDFTLRKEEPLVTRDMIFEIAARTATDGSVIDRPDAQAYDRVAAAIRRSGVESVAVQLLHSFRHPALEAEVAAQLADRLPDVAITRSAEIWPELGEFERSLVALMNAYVQPIMVRYLARLEARLAAIGVTSGLYITASNGGTISVASARARPIDTVLSGPASGVNAAARIAAEGGFERVVTIDMGGTSADLAVIDGAGASFTTNSRVGDFPLILPVLEVTAIGAGGGSIVWLDPQGVLKIGPESAGAHPGPVCYGRGGTRPTITDCYVALGCLDPDDFLGGRMRLDAAASLRALDALAARIGFEGPDRAVRAASAAVGVASALMASELQKSLARRGENAGDYALMAFGGAGPTHANFLAAEAGVSTIVIPAGSSTFCALGAVLADVMRDYVRSESFVVDADGAAAARLRAIFAALEADAAAWIASEGALIGQTAFAATLEMRYAGQAFELAVTVDDALRRAPDGTAIAELFHREHEKVYGFRDPDSAVEVMTERLRVSGRIAPVRLPEASATGEAPTGARRRVFLDGTWHDVPVRGRGTIGLRDVLPGPMIVEQGDSTALILPGWTGRMDRIGNLVITADTAGTTP